MKATQKAEAFYKEAQEHIKKQDFVQAELCLRESLKHKEKPEAYHNMAIIYYMNGNIGKAVELLSNAVRVDKNYHQGAINLARILHEHQDNFTAFEYCFMAVEADPDNKVYKEELIMVAKGLRFHSHSQTIRDIFLKCLQDETIDLKSLSQPWFSLLLTNPNFIKIYKLGQSKNYKDFCKHFKKIDAGNILTDPYFIAGLNHFIVPDIIFEQLLTYTRRYMLEECLNIQTRFLQQNEYNDFINAFANYCFKSRFIFHVTEKEEEQVSSLKSKIEDQSKSIFSLITFACYEPLLSLENAQNIAQKLPDNSQLKLLHITNPLKEKEIAAKISQLTEIKNDISEDVQQQYEEFPYPLWNKATSIPYYNDFLKERGAKTKSILIAGCGTGKEAVDMATALPDSQILAVDLSKASLSYAIRKSQELGLKNITYKQADINELKSLNENFDIITSCGVLHHMQDPINGWKILTDKLNSGGTMHIALYSEIARQAIVEARQVIRNKNYGDCASEIRRFRHDAKSIIKKKYYNQLLNWYDYFSMAECRDLIFHVQEHRFTIPQIRESLDSLGLSFDSFIIPPAVKNMYLQHFPQDKNLDNLENWARFEQHYNSVFMEMYDFWCVKN